MTTQEEELLTCEESEYEAQRSSTLDKHVRQHIQLAFQQVCQDHEQKVP